MLLCMRTTLDIDDDLLRRAKITAAASNKTLTSLVEDALRRALSDTRPDETPPRPLPVSGSGGLQPGVDLDDTSALLDRMDGLT